MRREVQREHERRERDDQQRRAPPVDAVAAVVGRLRDTAAGHDGGDDREDDAEREEPAPAAHAGEDPGDERADGDADRADRGPRAHGPTARVGRLERGRHERQHRGGDDGRTDPRRAARQDELERRLGPCRRKRRNREHAQPDEPGAAATAQVCDAA